ncbi:hypothetical protein BH23GEM2_BH23GEM2_09920 [soil metagenome]
MRLVRRSSFSILGFTAGVLAGAFAWSSVRHNFRRELFSRRPLARFVALTYLSSRPTLDTVRLLQDYVRWEQRPLLRRQGVRLLQSVESRLEDQN